MPPLWKDRLDYQRAQWTGPPLTSLTSTAGFAQDPNRGHIGIEARNCLSHALDGDLDIRPITAAIGASFDLDPPAPGSTAAYLRGNALETKDPTTDASATAGIVNVPPGVYTLTMRLGVGGPRIGSLRIAIRPGVWSNVAIFPSP